MRMIAMFLALFTTLAMLTAAASDQRCNFHLPYKDCTTWKAANFPGAEVGDRFFHLTQMTYGPSGITNSSRLKSALQVVSQCMSLPADSTVYSVAMDSNGCTKGDTSAGQGIELAHFNVAVLFSDPGCSFGPSNMLQPLSTKQDRGKWANRCWVNKGGWKSFALAYMDPKEL